MKMKLTQLQARVLVDTYKVLEDEFTTEGLDLVFIDPSHATFLVKIMLAGVGSGGIRLPRNPANPILPEEYHNPLSVLISEAHQTGASPRTINSMKVKAHSAGVHIFS
jgi:hypothetical protein